MKRLLNILFAASAVAFVSCADQDDAFDKSVSERINQTLEQYRSAFQIRGTWVLEYWPDNDLAYGGWIYVVEFKDGRYLESWFEGKDFVPRAEYASSPLLTGSEYQVEYSTGPMLKFCTHNDFLHYFAFPGATTGGYRGRRGDFEFTLMSISPAADEIIMRGVKTGNTMRMTPLTGYTADEYIAAVQQSQLAVNATSLKVMVNGEQIGTIERTSRTSLSNATAYSTSKCWTIRYSYQQQARGTDGNPVIDETGFPVYETVEVSDRLSAIHFPDGVMQLYEDYVFKGDAVFGLAGRTMRSFKWQLGATSALDGYLCTDSFLDIKLVVGN